MNPGLFENSEELGETLNALSSEKRLKAIQLIESGKPGKEVAEELDITRPSLQYYIQDFKDLGLVRSQGNDYEITDKGVHVLKAVNRVDEVITEARIQRKSREAQERHRGDSLEERIKKDQPDGLKD